MMQRQCECPKNKRFNNQNNNFAHAPGIFVYLFAIFVGLNYGEKIPNFVFYGERKQATTKFCFAFWTWTWSLGIHIQEGWWLHLNERMQINFLSSVLVAVTLRDLKVPSYNISKAQCRYSCSDAMNCWILAWTQWIVGNAKCLSNFPSTWLADRQLHFYNLTGQSWYMYIFKSWCTEGGPGQGLQNNLLFCRHT